MRYQNDANEIVSSIRSCDDLITELTNFGDDDNKKCALINALTFKRITDLYENPGRSFASHDALRRSHDESRCNLIKLIGLFPKDRRVGLIAGSHRGASTLVSSDSNHEVYLKDLIEKVFLEDGWYTDPTTMPNFVWTWESLVKNLAMYAKGKHGEQLGDALRDVLTFIPEDSIALFFNEIGVAKLLSLNSLDFLLEKYDVCETLILNGMNNEIKQLEEVPGVLRKIQPSGLKKCYDKLSEKIPSLANDINAFAYVLASFPDREFSASQIASLINAAPADMGIDALTNDDNKLVQVVLNLNPKLRLMFLKNLGIIDNLKTGITPEKQALKNVLRELLPHACETKKTQRDKFDDLTNYVITQVATRGAHQYAKHGVLGSANREFEAFLKSKWLDVKKPDNWKENVEMCRVWIPGLLRDCFLRPVWKSDQAFCQQINEDALNKLKLLAETGRYPEAELAMVIVSLAANKPVEVGQWLEKFKTWNTWFAWQEYKNNRRVMKGLTVVCQELSNHLDFEFNSPTWISDEGQKEIFISFVNAVKGVLNRMGDADKQRVLDYFKSPAFNCLNDEDMAKYKSAVIVQKAVKLLPTVPEDTCNYSCEPPAYADLFAVNTSNVNWGGKKLPFTPREDALYRGLAGGGAGFFNSMNMQIVEALHVPTENMQIVEALYVPTDALVTARVLESETTQKEEELADKKKTLMLLKP